MEYQSSQSHVLVTFWEVETEHLVYLSYFQAGRQNIFMIAHLRGYIFGIVVFIFYVSEYLFHNILKWNEAAGTAKFIDNDAYALLLL